MNWLLYGKEEISTKILAHDQHPSLGVIITYLGTGEHATEQRFAKVPTQDVQPGHAEQI